jgi:hypothetical protein
MQQEITIVEIDWTESVGPQTSVGSPYLFGWLRACYMEPGFINDGRVTVLVREPQSTNWVQHQGVVTKSEAENLAVAFALLGIAERAPRVEMVLDSSDTWFTSILRVFVSGHTQTFTIQTQSSGFQGPEADGLRSIFQRILDLSGYGHLHTIFCDPVNQVGVRDNERPDSY